MMKRSGWLTSRAIARKQLSRERLLGLYAHLVKDELRHVPREVTDSSKISVTFNLQDNVFEVGEGD